jgi:hypothetical protein
MGYAEGAEITGGYPTGFLSIADELGYTSWVSAGMGEAMKRWQVAVVASNALFF